MWLGPKGVAVQMPKVAASKHPLGAIVTDVFGERVYCQQCGHVQREERTVAGCTDCGFDLCDDCDMTHVCPGRAAEFAAQDAYRDAAVE